VIDNSYVTPKDLSKDPKIFAHGISNTTSATTLFYQFSMPMKHMCMDMVWKLFTSTLTVLKFLRIEGKPRYSDTFFPQQELQIMLE
jgi:hypothetical protein